MSNPISGIAFPGRYSGILRSRSAIPKHLFAALGILAGVCLSAIAGAQTVMPPSDQRHPFYVGVHAYLSEYEVYFHPSSNENATAGIGPWQLVAGGNIGPRLALQMGYSYRHEVDHLDPSYTGTTLAGQYVSGSSANDSWTHCLPLLARYAAVRSPGHRWQVDVLAGLTGVQTRQLAAAENRVDNQVVSRFSTDVRAVQLYASAGVGVRCSFGQHMEGVLDWTYSRNFRPAPEYAHVQATGNKYGLTRALSLGLRYRFAVRKKAATPAATP
jgi:hypothetical protein